MRPRISEFSFGFALTRELIDKKWSDLQLTAAPFFPSTVAEGRAGGGFDVALTSVTTLVFLQFKVSHYMTRRTAKGVKSGHLAVPYYRFDIHPPRSSDQHRLLLLLEQQQGPLPCWVRYVAPAFYTEGEFDFAFLQNTVSNQSVFVAPSDIILQSDGEHSVGYHSVSDQPVVLSEPLRIERNVDYSTFESDILRATRTAKPLTIDSEQIQNLRDALLAITKEVEPEAKPHQLFTEIPRLERERIPQPERMPRLNEAVIRQMRPLDAIGHVAWTQFACETIALGQG